MAPTAPSQPRMSISYTLCRNFPTSQSVFSTCQPEGASSSGSGSANANFENLMPVSLSCVTDAGSVQNGQAVPAGCSTHTKRLCVLADGARRQVRIWMLPECAEGCACLAFQLPRVLAGGSRTPSSDSALLCNTVLCMDNRFLPWPGALGVRLRRREISCFDSHACELNRARAAWRAQTDPRMPTTYPHAVEVRLVCLPPAHD